MSLPARPSAYTKPDQPGHDTKPCGVRAWRAQTTPATSGVYPFNLWRLLRRKFRGSRHRTLSSRLGFVALSQLVEVGFCILAQGSPTAQANTGADVRIDDVLFALDEPKSAASVRSRGRKVRGCVRRTLPDSTDLEADRSRVHRRIDPCFGELTNQEDFAHKDCSRLRQLFGRGTRSHTRASTPCSAFTKNHSRLSDSIKPSRITCVAMLTPSYQRQSRPSDCRQQDYQPRWPLPEGEQAEGGGSEGEVFS